MLIRAARPSFSGLLEAAKQLTIWSFSRKEDYHSSWQNDYPPRNFNRNFRRNPIRPQKKFTMLDEEEVDVELPPLEQLKPLEKNFYTPHPNVLNRSESEVQEFYQANAIRIFGNLKEKCPAPVLKFDELELPPIAQDVIRKLNYTSPTAIQSQTWPVALSGLNMVGVAQTGSGKTLGFVLPGMIHISHQPALEGGEGPIVVVISPTRELAQQTEKVILPFAHSYMYHTACVYGGSSRENQAKNLRGAHVCVGTPGRLIDFLHSGTINLNRCTYFVMDEADRLLNMGFEPQIRRIMKHMRPDSQILMWSATWPKEVQNLALDHLNDYVGVKFGSSELTVNPNITQHVHVCDKFKKRDMLIELLREISEEKEHKTLIYAQTKNMVYYLHRFLRENGYNVDYLHGDRTQFQRDNSMRAFRMGRTDILVGTGVIGRGLDVSDIKYVVIFDFPSEIEDYVHIIGRTGRSDKKGTAHILFTPDDVRLGRDLIGILEQSNQEINPELENLVNSSLSFRPPRRASPGNRYRSVQYR